MSVTLTLCQSMHFPDRSHNDFSSHLRATDLFLGKSLRSLLVSFFFFNDPATTEIYTLSLHDALPISHHRHPLVEREQRSLAGVDRDADDEPVDDRRGAPDDVEVAVRARVERARINADLR